MTASKGEKGKWKGAWNTQGVQHSVCQAQIESGTYCSFVSHPLRSQILIMEYISKCKCFISFTQGRKTNPSLQRALGGRIRPEWTRSDPGHKMSSQIEINSLGGYRILQDTIHFISPSFDIILVIIKLFHLLGVTAVTFSNCEKLEQIFYSSFYLHDWSPIQSLRRSCRTLRRCEPWLWKHRWCLALALPRSSC